VPLVVQTAASVCIRHTFFVCSFGTVPSASCSLATYRDAALRDLCHQVDRAVNTVSEGIQQLKMFPEARVRFPALPDFLRSSGSATGFTQSREYN
jgi:hypothetical protein